MSDSRFSRGGSPAVATGASAFDGEALEALAALVTLPAARPPPEKLLPNRLPFVTPLLVTGLLVTGLLVTGLPVVLGLEPLLDGAAADALTSSAEAVMTRV